MINKNLKIRCVLFDLDGTLVDTSEDLLAAVNAVLHSEQKPPLSNGREFRQQISFGVKGMLRFAFGAMSEAVFQSRRDIFIASYQNNLLQASRLFPGVLTHLDYLYSQDIAWGVVTNKAEHFAHSILDGLNILSECRALVGGDTLPVCKPDPAPLLRASELCRVSVSDCLYIGDAANDVTAGNAAGMKTLIARYGFIDPLDDFNAWGADGMISHPAEIQGWLS